MIKLIFGCGYLGGRVAVQWLQDGHQVFAVTRSPARAAAFMDLGLRPIIADILEPDSLSGLPAAETVLFAVGYDRTATATITETYVQGLQNVLTRLPAATERLIYTSSTGVYGQASGQWVDETSPCRPGREGGAACLAAEQLLLVPAWSRRTVVLRMSGIYGPGRIPRRRELESGRPLAAPREGYLNLLHVEDAAAAVLAAACGPGRPGTYCVSDGQPVVRGEYYRYLAELLQAPEPQFTEPPPDSPARQRAGSSKRIRNTLFCREFGFRFQYPSYREGLAAIVAAEH